VRDRLRHLRDFHGLLHVPADVPVARVSPPVAPRTACCSPLAVHVVVVSGALQGVGAPETVHLVEGFGARELVALFGTGAMDIGLALLEITGASPIAPKSSSWSGAGAPGARIPRASP
jgi:hypothetical protein